MDTSFTELKQITDEVYRKLEKTGKIIPYGSRVVALLNKYDIKLRQKDGKLAQINISIPKTVQGIVVGLRYTKNDNTKTEDLFLFQEGQTIVAGYKGNLEKTLQEYKGSHKLQR